MECTKIIYNMAKMSMSLFLYSGIFPYEMLDSYQQNIYSNNLTNREYLAILEGKNSIHSPINCI